MKGVSTHIQACATCLSNLHTACLLQHCKLRGGRLIDRLDGSAIIIKPIIHTKVLSILSRQVSTSASEYAHVGVQGDAAPFIDPGSTPVPIHRCAAEIPQPEGVVCPAPLLKLIAQGRQHLHSTASPIDLLCGSREDQPDASTQRSRSTDMAWHASALSKLSVQAWWPAYTAARHMSMILSRP